jgi:hypothetical protein
VLPPGALLVIFSPLVDDRSIDVATDLRERGYAVILADVLTAPPEPPRGSATGALALRCGGWSGRRCVSGWSRWAFQSSAGRANRESR